MHPLTQHFTFHFTNHNINYIFYSAQQCYTKVEPERSCQICILSIFGSGLHHNWMNCISATTSTTFKCLDTAGQSINLILNMLPKLKNRSVFSGVPIVLYKSRLFWFPEKYQKSNLWELGGLTAAALSYSWRIFTGLLHSESFILVNH